VSRRLAQLALLAEQAFQGGRSALRAGTWQPRHELFGGHRPAAGLNCGSIPVILSRHLTGEVQLSAGPAVSYSDLPRLALPIQGGYYAPISRAHARLRGHPCADSLRKGGG